MRYVLLVIVLSCYVRCSFSSSKADSRVSPQGHNHGSHNLLKLDALNSSINRVVRCTPCGTDGVDRRPVSNHLNPEYRGNGADNLGYDWSPMAWGGLAFPHRSKMFVGGMRGRDGKQMPGNWGQEGKQMPGNWGRDGKQMPRDWAQNQESVRVVCDTCRSYWDDKTDGGGRGSSPSYYLRGQNRYPDPWEGNRMMRAQDYETRVSSPTVGVLVKPGSRIAYIPSRSGEMFWDGVSGGGTRWDGFSNGISWVGNGGQEWDRSDSTVKEDQSRLKLDSRSEYPYNPSSFGSWNAPNGRPGWGNGGKNYYFSNGHPNEINPQWGDQGYASNWHYGSTDQNGWNGNSMKWNYGKQWVDNDRAANRFYFNSPQNRIYGSAGGSQYQYGNQYPNYQSAAGYPDNFRPRPSWRPDGNHRLNDRDPSMFQPAGPYAGDKEKPWDYSSGDPFDYKKPGSRPDWVRPGPSYPAPGGYNRDPPGKGFDRSPYLSGDKFSNKNDYDKPWNGPGRYGNLKPSEGGDFPYGGNRYPDEGRRPYPGGGGLFYPGEGNQPLSYPNSGSNSGGSGRPIYLSGGNKPNEYPGTSNQIGSYPNVESRPSSGYSNEARPGSVSSSGGSYRPSEIDNSRPFNKYPGSSSTYPSVGSSTSEYSVGGSSGGYSGGASSTGSYPNRGSSTGGYPNRGISTVGYPTKGSGTGGYPSPGNGYPNGGVSYPFGSKYPDGYPSSGSYPNVGGGPGQYLGGRPSGYPENQGSYPGGSFYLDGTNQPGEYSNVGGFSSVGSRPYPGHGSGYPGYAGGGYPRRPGEYPGVRPLHPIMEQSSYPASRPQGGNNPSKGYYTGFITEIGLDDGYSTNGGKYPSYLGGNYPGDKNMYSEKNRNPYPGGDSNRYPSFGEDRFTGYPTSVKNKYPGQNGGSDRFYYGQSNLKGKYPDGYSSETNRYSSNGGSGDFDRNSSSSDDKNSWNYGQDERKEGIYRRSGGSYPPYRGGQYYTSSYLASMTTTLGSTVPGSEAKTSSATKPDVVTQPTPEA